MQQYFPGKFLYGGDYNPEQWSEDIWQDDMRLMKLAHVNMVSINIFSWASLEPQPEQYSFETLDRIMDLLTQHGIGVDLATATASPPTWMSKLYPSMLPVTREGVRLSHGSRQHYCPNSPDFRRKAGELVQHLAERYAQHPALQMWHLNNEYGCHVAQCYCDNCEVAFRSWLQQRYSTLEALNAAWGTSFWSQYYYNWEDILPPRISPTFNNPGQTLDYWRFMNESLLGCYEVEERILRRVTPNIPLTTNLMVGFKPVDAFSWEPHMDLISFDMYPPRTASVSSVAISHDLMRSLKHGQPHIIMEQSPSQVNWMPQNPHKRPGRMRLHSLQALAHGANGVMFFQWRQSQAGAEKYHGAVVTHEGTEHTRIFRQAAQVGEELARLAPMLAASTFKAEVAIVIDWNAWWAVEFLPSPTDRLRYMEQVLNFYSAFHQLNVAIDFAAPESDLSQYRLVLAPTLYLFQPGVKENLEQFVSQGGTLLTNFFSGIVDQQDRIFLGGYPGALRKVLGIHVEEFDPFTPDMSNTLEIAQGELAGSYPSTLWGELIHLEGAQALGVFGSDYYAQHPALTVNTFGQGRAYYLATQSSSELMNKLAALLCHEAGVEPVLSAPTGVEVTRRTLENGRAAYFILNHTEESQQVTLPPGTFTSLLHGQSASGTITLSPVDAEVLLAE